MNRINRRSTVLLAAAGLLGASVTGCASSGTATTDEDVGRVMKDPGVNLRAGLPPGAQEVGQKSEAPSWRATERGIIYVYDQNANQLVGTVNMMEGQELVVSGPTGRATLTGNEIHVGKLRAGRIYGLYFLSTPGGADAEGNVFRITPANENNK